MGGPPGGGRGGPPRDMKAGAPPAATPMVDPLKAFFEQLRSLREVILLRDDQTEAWVALRDGLREYAISKPSRPPAPGNGQSAQDAIRIMADEARHRADNLQHISASLDTLRGVLDEHQRALFDARLQSTFAAD